MNEIILDQALDPSQATLIENYFIDRSFRLVRRRGSKKLAEVASNVNGIEILKQWTDTLFIIGYGKVLAVFNKNDDTINSIKTNFAANLTDGLRWGNDFYSCNGRLGDKIYKTTLPTLAYKTQTVNFVVGLVVTGGTSGATATIISDADGGATGTLTVDNITGTFQADEALTDSGTGAAVVTSTIDYTNTAEISAGSGTVPKCESLNVFDLALHAVGTDGGKAWVHASEKNDFTKWAVGSNAGDPYIVKFERAGAAVDMSNLQNTAQGSESFGDVGVIFYKDGKYAFTNQVFDSGGTPTQKQTEFFQKLDDGGERGVFSSPLGIFYGNENGEFLLKRDGSKLPLMETFSETTIENLSATDSDRIFLPEREILLVTLKNQSATNNTVYWFDTKSLSRKKITWGKITGWNINRFLLVGRTIYGGASGSPKVNELLPDSVWDDEGVDVFYKYNQPMNFGSFEGTKDLFRLDIGGFLSSTTSISVDVFGVDEVGNETDLGFSYTFSGSGASGDLEGLGESSWGEDGFDSVEAQGGTRFLESKGNQKAYNFKSYRVKISGNDKLPNTLVYLSVQGSERRPQRQRLL